MAGIPSSACMWRACPVACNPNISTSPPNPFRANPNIIRPGSNAHYAYVNTTGLCCNYFSAAGNKGNNSKYCCSKKQVFHNLFY
jgi:hypothetical protein